jgi:hypothetical protein
MFKVLYRCNRTIERHTNSPLADPTRLCLVGRITGNLGTSLHFSGNGTIAKFFGKWISARRTWDFLLTR